MSESDLLHELKSARSLPLGLVAQLIDGVELTIAGILGGELSRALRKTARIFEPPRPGLALAPAPRWSGTTDLVIDPASLYETDILIITDLSWAARLMSDPYSVRAAATSVRHSLIFPVVLRPNTGLSVSWLGFSDLEYVGGRACRRLDSSGESRITVRGTPAIATSVLLHFSLLSVLGQQIEVKYGSKVGRTGTSDFVELDLTQGEAVVPFNLNQASEACAVALASPWLQSGDGRPMAGEKALLEPPVDRAGEWTDRLSRMRLHQSGFPYVGAVVRSEMGGSPAFAPTTTASIFDVEISELGSGGSYTDVATRSGDIVWYIASMAPTDLWRSEC